MENYEEIYKVKFINKTDGNREVDFPDRNPLPLAPKETLEILISDANHLYAPYAEVVYEKDESVKVIPRKGFRHPKRRWPTVKFLNESGTPVESVFVGLFNKNTVELPVGIPCISSVDPFLDIAEYEEFIIKRVETAKAHPRFPGYLVTDIQIHRNAIKRRSEKELQRLWKLREEIQLKDFNERKERKKKEEEKFKREHPTREMASGGSMRK